MESLFLHFLGYLAFKHIWIKPLSLCHTDLSNNYRIILQRRPIQKIVINMDNGLIPRDENKMVCNIELRYVSG